MCIDAAILIRDCRGMKVHFKSSHHSDKIRCISIKKQKKIHHWIGFYWLITITSSHYWTFSLRFFFYMNHYLFLLVSIKKKDSLRGLSINTSLVGIHNSLRLFERGSACTRLLGVIINDSNRTRQRFFLCSSSFISSLTLFTLPFSSIQSNEPR